MKEFYCLLRGFGVLILMICVAFTAHAQLVSDGTSKTINATATNLTGDVVIGTNAPFTSLTIINGGSVTNSGNSTIGLNTTAKTNQVIVSDAGSSWSMSGNLVLGSSGSYELLVISNGAKVVNNFGNIALNAGSTGNSAIVTGSNSLWTNAGNVNVGNAGGFNSLTVSNGATVAIAITSGINVGNIGASNQLTITSGGVVTTGGAKMGLGPFSGGNVAIVSGSGSLWTNNGELDIGPSGSFNNLLITNGGQMFSAGAFIGANAVQGGSGNSNLVVLAGQGSSWTNTAGLGLGNIGSYNQLVISNGAVLRSTSANAFYVATQSGSSNNSVMVSGTHSIFTMPAGSLYVGLAGSSNQFSVRNGGLLQDGLGTIGDGGTNNAVIIADPGSVWTNTSDLNVGEYGVSTRLIVTNGGNAFGVNGYIGGTGGGGNLALIAGTNSLWKSYMNLYVGYSSVSNQLVITNAGSVIVAQTTELGFTPNASSNLVVVAGTNSVLTNLSLYIGAASSFNQVIVTNGGTVQAATARLGVFQSSSNNTLLVSGATLLATNFGSGVLDVRRGNLAVNGSSSVVTVDQLLVTNGNQAAVAFNAGTLQTGSTIVSNGSVFAIGDGVSAASLQLLGSGTHTFADGLTVRSGALLLGNGTIIGPVTVQSGATLAPGSSVGKLVLSNPPILQGQIVMELSKSGGITNDQLQVAGPLSYSGKLLVTNIGPGSLAVGDEFPLFNAASYAGSFSSVTLPPLAGGLAWTNQLLSYGSIAVVATPPLGFGSIQRSGTNVIMSGTGGTAGGNYVVLATTNAALPATNWTRVLTNQFDAFGAFSFTNTVTPATPAQFYRLLLP